MAEADPRLAFLDARDQRQQALDLASSEPPRFASILMISTNLPGREKHRPGVSRLFQAGCSALQASVAPEFLASGVDALGPYLVAGSHVEPRQAKLAAIAIEAEGPGARLLDVDVHLPDGRPLGREALGVPPRRCLVCGEPARTCIRLQRHAPHEVQACAEALLAPFAVLTGRLDPEALAVGLVEGALQELNLSPKPGLVDRLDQGSHPDLTFESMHHSARLLAIYLDDLLECQRAGRPLGDFVQAGLEAERRMWRAVHANSHKGYIFLAGLLLVAACNCCGRLEYLRSAISAVAAHLFGQESPAPAESAGGIRSEAMHGLPAVFEHGWPRYREALALGWPLEEAGFLLMGVLMQHVEDTTAVHRCGVDGLARVRGDGARLQQLLERRQDPRPFLRSINHDYRSSNLTMGGVADCMALVFALESATRTANLPPVLALGPGGPGGLVADLAHSSVSDS